jgi:hypothetical protein
MQKITKWINYNRFIVIGPIVAAIVWGFAVGCIPQTESPTRPGYLVSAPQLQTEYTVWLKQQEIEQIRFTAAGEDLEQQKAQQAEFMQLIVKLASGGVADLSGLIQLLAGGTLLGAVSDNIRKRGLIAGLKRNGTK